MQALTLKIAGLHTSPNQYSEVPPGALVTANDIVINQASVAEPRRGSNRLGVAMAGTPNALFFYKNTLHAHQGASTMCWYNAGAWTTISGTFTPPTGAKVRAFEGNQNFYFTTATGVWKLSSAGGTATLSGVPKAIDITASMTNDATGFIAATGGAVAYRLVWGIRDANNNVILGAPSQRSQIDGSNTGSVRRVDVAVSIPAGITTSHFYQLYRSKTESTGVTPSDELQLVYEGTPTSGEISALTLTIADVTPDSLRGATLYTSQSQEGLTAGNERPPLCVDVATFKGTSFYANTTTPQRLTITLLSVALATNNSLDNNDTVTIAGTTFTAKTAPSAATDFQIVSSGTAATNIRDTALALVRKINSQSSTVYAYYLSSTTDLPGKILIEARSLGASTFAASTGAGSAGAWNGLGTSSADAFLNGIYYSKPSQPEAVPLTNFFQVGSRDKAILRIVPLQDTLFVFKEDGLYRISESGGAGFTVQPFDFSAKLLSNESPAVLNNQIYALTDQGVVTVTDTGVSVISRPIERELVRSQALAASVLKSSSFGVAYEQDRKYLLFIPEETTDTLPSCAYVWDTFTATWVRWSTPRRCGIVGPVNLETSAVQDCLYLGETVSNFVRIERKTLTYADHVDFKSTLTISSATGTTVNLAADGDTVSLGDVLYQSATVWAQVVARTNNTLTMSIDAGFAAASVSVFSFIPVRIKWAPQALGNPGILKQTSECAFLFRAEYGGLATCGFASDLSPGEETVRIDGAGNGIWGSFVWSEDAIWGGEQFRRPRRVWIPREKQLGSYLNISFEHGYGFESFALEGISVFSETIGDGRVRK